VDKSGGTPSAPGFMCASVRGHERKRRSHSSRAVALSRLSGKFGRGGWNREKKYDAKSVWVYEMRAALAKLDGKEGKAE